jgi:hypothetical protein
MGGKTTSEESDFVGGRQETAKRPSLGDAYREGSSVSTDVHL